MKTTRLHGRVLMNGEGVSAELVFQANSRLTGDDQLTAGPRSVGRSDPAGQFEVPIWPDGYIVAVSPDGQERPASPFRLYVEEGDEQQKDFLISANTVVVTLVDRETSRGVPGRLVVSGILRVDDAALPLVHTDEDGRARLLSVHSGRVHVIAIAPGFVKTTAVLEVVDAEGEQSFEIRLDSERAGWDFRVVLPDGSSASGVEAFYRYDSESGMRLRIPCDDQGICHPAGALAESDLVGLFHPGAGLTVVSARQIRVTGVAVLRPGGGRLEVRIETETDNVATYPLHAVVRFDGIAVGSYLPGVFLSGEASTFGPHSGPMWFEGLPAGRMTVEIQALEFDDQSRRIGKTVAGPFSVTLPSEPVTVRLR